MAGITVGLTKSIRQKKVQDYKTFAFIMSLTFRNLQRFDIEKLFKNVNGSILMAEDR